MHVIQRSHFGFYEPRQRRVSTHHSGGLSIHFDHLGISWHEPKSRLHGTFFAINLRQIAGTTGIRTRQLGICRLALYLGATEAACRPVNSLATIWRGHSLNILRNTVMHSCDLKTPVKNNFGLRFDLCCTLYCNTQKTKHKTSALHQGIKTVQLHWVWSRQL